jgi:hypothetical protein
VSTSVQLVGRVVRSPEPSGEPGPGNKALVVVAGDGLVMFQSPPEWVQVLTVDEPQNLDLAIGDIVEASGPLKISRWTRTDGAPRQALRVHNAEVKLVRRQSQDQRQRFQEAAAT